MSSSLQKTKFYFFIIACITAMTLLVYTYKWNIPERIYRISTSHETHVHIQSPPIDRIDIHDKLISKSPDDIKEIKTKTTRVPANNEHVKEADGLTKVYRQIATKNDTSNKTLTNARATHSDSDSKGKTKQRQFTVKEKSKQSLINENDLKTGITGTQITSIMLPSKTAVNPLDKYIDGDIPYVNISKPDKSDTKLSDKKTGISKDIQKENESAISKGTISKLHLKTDTEQLPSAWIEEQKPQYLQLNRTNIPNKIMKDIDKTLTAFIKEKIRKPTKVSEELGLKHSDHDNNKNNFVYTKIPLIHKELSSSDLKINSNSPTSKKLHDLINDTIGTVPNNTKKDVYNTTENIPMNYDKGNEPYTVDEVDKEAMRRKIIRLKNSITTNNHLGLTQGQPPDFKYSRARMETQARDRLKSSLRKLGVSGNLFDQLNKHVKEDPNINTEVNPIPKFPLSNVTVRPDICKKCFRTDFKLMLNVPNVCEKDVDVLLLISSAAANQESRNTIRRTWGSVCYKPESKIKCVFMLGNNDNPNMNRVLMSENEKYHDIVQHDFHDSYANLTYKTMTGLRWASQKCNNAKYVMKTDDDMFLNTELLPILLKATPTESFMGGFCWGPSSPHRDTSSKWYVSFEQYTRPYYPKMCSGTGYVMSRDVVTGILKHSADVPFFYLEDVYVALCLNKMGIVPETLVGFSNTLVDFDACSYRNRVVTSHSFSPNSLEYAWSESRTCPKDDLTPNMLYRVRPY